MLDAYGFYSVDDLDRALIEGLQNGFFDPARIEAHLVALDRKVKGERARGSIEDGWRKLYDSFKDNEQEIVDTLVETTLTNVEHISLLDLDNTVRLLKELGREDETPKLIQAYMATRTGSRTSFNLAIPFRDRIKDPDVLRAFAEKYSQLTDERTPHDILINIARTQSWNEPDLAALAQLSVEEYYNLFRATEGQDLRDILHGCFFFVNIAGASNDMREISKRSREALTRLGKETRLNAIRVERLGIKVPEEAQ